MSAPSRATSVVNACVNGAIRIPALTIGALAGLQLGEGVLRVLGTVSGFFGVQIKFKNVCYFAVEKMPGSVGEVLNKVQLRPFKELSHKELFVVTLTSAALSTLGMELSNYLCGKIPPIYNKCLKWIGPLQFNEKWRNPAVEYFWGPHKDTSGYQELGK